MHHLTRTIVYAHHPKMTIFYYNQPIHKNEILTEIPL